MNDIIIPDEKRHLDFAFKKFWSLKQPVRIDSRIYTSEYHGSLHNHDFPQIWYCLDGSYLHQVEGHVYECAKGSVVVIQTGAFHKFRIPEGEKAEILSLSVMYDIFLNAPIHQYINTIAVLFLSPFARELGHTAPRYLMLSQSSQRCVELTASWLSLTRFEPPHQNITTDICNKLEEMFSLPEFAIPDKCREKAVWLSQSRYLTIARVLSYLNAHYYERIGEDELLQVSDVCHTELYRHFKRFTGYTVSEYHRMLRIRHVSLYLRFTTYPLSYISDVCGFYDLSHMTRLFKKYMGQTPKGLRTARKAWLEKNPDQKTDFKYL